MPTTPNLYKQVVRYIEDRLDEPLNTESLCSAFNLSKYHFNRQFSALIGLPPILFIRLLQLKKAAYQLAFRTDIKIIDIALASGFESHEGFCRAFKKHFGLSPTDFRHSPDWTWWQSHYEPIAQLRNKIVNEDQNTNVDIVMFEETSVAVLAHHGSPQILSHSIQQFIAWRKANRLPPSKSRTFNLLYEDPNTVAPEEFRFDLCCAVNGDIAPNDYGVTKTTIPAGKCAKLRYTGSDDGMGPHIHYLYTQWLDQSGYQLRDFPIFLERVSFFPEVPENTAITDIYLPIT